MAGEILADIKIAYEDSEGTSILMAALAQVVDVTTKRVIQVKHNVGIAEEALILGDVTSLGVIVLRNWDTVNFVELRVGTGGTKCAKWKASECWAFRFGSGVTAPYLIADTAACQVEYLLVSN